MHERRRETDAGGPRPFRPRIGARPAYAAHRLLARNRLYHRLAAAVERRPGVYRWFTTAERVTKERLFGCRMCGQCALPATGYACPMTCPKQLRNGPCGGASPTGRCEVVPELTCVWVIAGERAAAGGHDADLDLLLRPADHRQWTRSSWVNYWQGRDEGLWIDPADERLRADPTDERRWVDPPLALAKEEAR
ncbi:methylenetetrahydrofolate reductase C-terminal domain-containing protein [Dactylosporangium sp. CA-092794]|uniref:methylenetetrahydrofolate reductase C-terminal domain-containing protein n=1 Tax=Dactylosporangium sp. CA-092794 TaxID=3239929 RepID=UPI003D8F69C6